MGLVWTAKLRKDNQLTAGEIGLRTGYFWRISSVRYEVSIVLHRKTTLLFKMHNEVFTGGETWCLVFASKHSRRSQRGQGRMIQAQQNAAVSAQGQAHGHSLCLEMFTISRLEKNSAVSTLACRLPGKLSRRFCLLPCCLVFCSCPQDFPRWRTTETSFLTWLSCLCTRWDKTLLWVHKDTHYGCHHLAAKTNSTRSRNVLLSFPHLPTVTSRREQYVHFHVHDYAILLEYDLSFK